VALEGNSKESGSHVVTPISTLPLHEFIWKESRTVNIRVLTILKGSIHFIPSQPKIMLSAHFYNCLLTGHFQDISSTKFCMRLSSTFKSCNNATHWHKYRHFRDIHLFLLLPGIWR
jgi:hypothetical protein